MDKNKIKYIEHRLEFERNHLLDMLPDVIKEDFASQSYIAGGCIYSLYHNTEPKDYDFFVLTNMLAERIREYFLNKSGYHGKISCGTYKDYPLLVTDNAVSIGKYQIITRWTGLPMDVVEQFDFKHLMYYYKNNKINSVNDEFESLASNSLKYNEQRARDIVGTIMRVNKFVDRGMKCNQKEMSKMLLKLNDVGFSDWEVSTLNEAKEKPETEHFGS